MLNDSACLGDRFTGGPRAQISPGAMLWGISAPSTIAAIGALIQLDCVSIICAWPSALRRREKVMRASSIELDERNV